MGWICVSYGDVDLEVNLDRGAIEIRRGTIRLCGISRVEEVEGVEK